MVFYSQGHFLCADLRIRELRVARVDSFPAKALRLFWNRSTYKGVFSRHALNYRLARTNSDWLMVKCSDNIGSSKYG